MKRKLYKIFNKEVLDATIGVVLNLIAAIYLNISDSVSNAKVWILFIVIAFLWIIYFWNSKRLFKYIKKFIGFNAIVLTKDEIIKKFDDVVEKCKYLNIILKEKSHTGNNSSFDNEYLFDIWRNAVTDLHENFLKDGSTNYDIVITNEQEFNSWNRKKGIPQHYVNSVVEILLDFQLYALPTVLENIKIEQKAKIILINDYHSKLEDLKKSFSNN